MFFQPKAFLRKEDYENQFGSLRSSRDESQPITGHQTRSSPDDGQIPSTSKGPGSDIKSISIAYQGCLQIRKKNHVVNTIEDLMHDTPSSQGNACESVTSPLDDMLQTPRSPWSQSQVTLDGSPLSLQSLMGFGGVPSPQCVSHNSQVRIVVESELEPQSSKTKSTTGEPKKNLFIMDCNWRPMSADPTDSSQEIEISERPTEPQSDVQNAQPLACAREGLNINEHLFDQSFVQNLLQKNLEPCVANNYELHYFDVANQLIDFNETEISYFVIKKAEQVASRFQGMFYWEEILKQSKTKIMGVYGNYSVVELQGAQFVAKCNTKPFKMSHLLEAEILLKLSHSNLVKAHYFFQQGCQFYLVVPLADQSLNLAILLKNSPIPFTSNQIGKVGQNILQGLDYLHNLNIIHMQVSLQSIFYNNGYFKLGNLEEAVKVEYVSKTSVRPLFNLASAPEIIPDSLLMQHNIPQRQTPVKITVASDIYSFGFVIGELVSMKEGGPLHHLVNSTNIRYWIAEKLKLNLTHFLNLCPNNSTLEEFFSQSLTGNRSSAKDLLKIHYFL